MDLKCVDMIKVECCSHDRTESSESRKSYFFKVLNEGQDWNTRYSKISYRSDVA